MRRRAGAASETSVQSSSTMHPWFRPAPASPESDENWDLRRKPQRVSPEVTGILAFGDNHLILNGPAPDIPTARELARHWSVIHIGAETPGHLRQWNIVTRAFREELEWAVVVPAESAINPAVSEVLREIQSRGVEVRYAS